MLKMQSKRTPRKKLKMSQKNKLTSASKVKRLSTDAKMGVVSIYSTQNIVTCEKAIMNFYNGIKKSTKKLACVWVKPLQVKTTTTKGEKRLGKGKGNPVTYNRAVPIIAGLPIVEIGYLTQMSIRKSVHLPSLIHTLKAKLPCSIAIKVYPGVFTSINTLQSTNYYPYK